MEPRAMSPKTKSSYVLLHLKQVKEYMQYIPNTILKHFDYVLSLEY